MNHFIVPGDAEVRHRCEARTCAMRARNVATYRGLSKHLCNAHARSYVEWGDRDREQMACSLWAWESPAEVRAMLHPDSQLEFAGDAGLPARGRTAGVRQASGYLAGRRNRGGAE